jgi:hypothetical protein
LHKQTTEDAAAQTKTHAPYYYTVILLLNDVLKNFKKESVPHLLGFKLSSYHAQSKIVGEAPYLLYLCTAFLIYNGLLSIQDLIPHLEPCINQFQDAYKTHRTEEKKRIRKLGVISLNAAASSKPNNDKNSNVDGAATSTKNKPTDNTNTSKVPVFQNQVTSLLSALLSFEA